MKKVECPQKRSVSTLKQIFETNSHANVSSNASILRRIQKVKHAQINKNESSFSQMAKVAVESPSQHIYVNERVSKPANV